jgi:NTP pyrophosphatase (non-canonical NTP hydrolase)
MSITDSENRRTLDASEYVELAKDTDVQDYTPVRERIADLPPEMLHAMLGITSEAGEVADQFKRHLIYGKELDVVNLMEEMGDLFWYCAILSHHLDVSFETVMYRNIAKLRARYPDKFTKDSAINRDLAKERAILEGNETHQTPDSKG